VTDTNGLDQTRFVRPPASSPAESHDPEADGVSAGPFDQTHVAKVPPAPAKMSLDEVDFDVTSGFGEGPAEDSANVFDITKGADDAPFDVAPDLAVAEAEPVVAAAPVPDPVPAQGSSATLYLAAAIIVVAAGVAAWLMLF